MDGRERGRVRDEEHLKILSVVSYVLGGIGAFFGMFPLIHIFLGLVLLGLPLGGRGPEEIPARFLGFVLLAIGSLIFVLAQSFAALKFYLGYNLARRRHRVGCMVASAILCLGIPYSTALGVLSLIVLQRDSVRSLFDESPSP